QAGGALDEAHAAHVGGGGKAGDVADNAASQGHNHALAVQVGLKKAVIKVADSVQGFVLFPGGNGDDSRSLFDEGRIERRDMAVADHHKGGVAEGNVVGQPL